MVSSRATRIVLEEQLQRLFYTLALPGSCFKLWFAPPSGFSTITALVCDGRDWVWLFEKPYAFIERDLKVDPFH